MRVCQSEEGGVGLKERARFDSVFTQKILDVKRRLQDTRWICLCVGVSVFGVRHHTRASTQAPHQRELYLCK